jgi:hypothetical protein
MAVVVPGIHDQRKAETGQGLVQGCRLGRGGKGLVHQADQRLAMLEVLDVLG